MNQAIPLTLTESERAEFAALLNPLPFYKRAFLYQVVNLHLPFCFIAC